MGIIGKEIILSISECPIIILTRVGNSGRNVVGCGSLLIELVVGRMKSGLGLITDPEMLSRGKSEGRVKEFWRSIMPKSSFGTRPATYYSRDCWLN